MSCNNTYNFNIVKGCSFIVYLNVQNSDGTYLNLSGYNASGYIISQFGDTGYIYNLNPQCVEPKASGIIMISGGAYETSQLPVGGFFYNICVFNDDDFGLQAINGDFNILPTTSIF